MKTTAIEKCIIRLAGDSGDGMQITGDRLALISALFGNDVVTLADYPAEIRAPQGTTYGVSGYQLQIGKVKVHTPGDKVDILVAMNPAALVVNINRVKEGGIVIVNSDSFDKKNFERAKLDSDPLDDPSMEKFDLHKINMTERTLECLKDSSLSNVDKARCKNFLALGCISWLLTRPVDTTKNWLKEKFAKKPEIADANIKALNEGYVAADTLGLVAFPFSIEKQADTAKGQYRFVSGNQAIALGLCAAGVKSERGVFYSSYPITPASDILHEMAKLRGYGVKSLQAEDEIAAVGNAIGAAYAGSLAATATSGPGMVLKQEFIALAVMAELPLVVVDVQRAGPSTGMPTKTEQTDLLLSMYGRNGESPVIVLAASSPADCFQRAYEASKLAIKYMVPVVVLSDAYLANGREPWEIVDPDTLDKIETTDFPDDEIFRAYKRDPETLSRPWKIPGEKGFEHRIGGLEKDYETGDISYDGDNHQKMVALRQAKIDCVRQDIPATKIKKAAAADHLLLSWGSIMGSARRAFEELENTDTAVDHTHIHHLSPLPADLATIFNAYKKIFVAEQNSGHLLMVLRKEFPSIEFVGIQSITGQPFKVELITQKIIEGV